jgi:hypothetical protein
VRQALCGALHAELSDFYRLMAVMEAHASQPIPVPGEPTVSCYTEACLSVYTFKAVPIMQLRFEGYTSTTGCIAFISVFLIWHVYTF